MMSNVGSKKMRLSSEGELNEVESLDSLIENAHEPEAPGQSQGRTQAIYCTQCGSGNPGDSKYCRTCGSALALQVAPATGTARKAESSKAADRADKYAPYRSPAPHMAESLEKRKNDQLEFNFGRRGTTTKAEMTFFAAILRIVTMVMTTGMVICSVVAGFPLIALPVLIAMIAVEGIRSGNRQVSFFRMISDIVTMIMVTGMVITSFFVSGGSGSWISIPILILWIAIEGIRSDG